VRTSTLQNDPVNRALLDYGYSPGRVPTKVDGRVLSPQEHDRYQAEAGQRSYQAIQELLGTDTWARLGPDDRRDALQGTVRDARKAAREDLFGGATASVPGLPPPPPGFTLDGGAQADADIPPPPPGYTMTDTAPPPEGFTIDDASAGADVYNDLQAAIPGVRITSGYRDEAYQADMRRRGYRPAQNSTHLDGSALDLLPPPGRSMAWLRDQVRRYDPDARILDEGDHLHVTFPGYYGAPALGGARTAGLRNPLEAIPPAPPGFVLVP